MRKEKDPNRISNLIPLCLIGAMVFLIVGVLFMTRYEKGQMQGPESSNQIQPAPQKNQTPRTKKKIRYRRSVRNLAMNSQNTPSKGSTPVAIPNGLTREELIERIKKARAVHKRRLASRPKFISLAENAEILSEVNYNPDENGIHRRVTTFKRAGIKYTLRAEEYFMSSKAAGASSGSSAPIQISQQFFVANRVMVSVDPSVDFESFSKIIEERGYKISKRYENLNKNIKAEEGEKYLYAVEVNPHEYEKSLDDLDQIEDSEGRRIADSFEDPYWIHATKIR